MTDEQVLLLAGILFLALCICYGLLFWFVHRTFHPKQEKDDAEA